MVEPAQRAGQCSCGLKGRWLAHSNDLQVLERFHELLKGAPDAADKDQKCTVQVPKPDIFCYCSLPVQTNCNKKILWLFVRYGAAELSFQGREPSLSPEVPKSLMSRSCSAVLGQTQPSTCVLHHYQITLQNNPSSQGLLSWKSFSCLSSCQVVRMKTLDKLLQS